MASMGSSHHLVQQIFNKKIFWVIVVEWHHAWQLVWQHWYLTIFNRTLSCIKHSSRLCKGRAIALIDRHGKVKAIKKEADHSFCVGKEYEMGLFRLKLAHLAETGLKNFDDHWKELQDRLLLKRLLYNCFCKIQCEIFSGKNSTT